MPMMMFLIILVALLLLLLLCVTTTTTATLHVSALKQSYVVYMGEHSHGPAPTMVDLHRATDSHHEFLASFLGSKDMARDAIFYSYTRSINGFAALIDDDLAAHISKHPDVVSVFLNRGAKLHTTHSWEFLMLEKYGGVIRPSSLWNKANFGQDIIIASLDSGVWPESKSFSDESFGPIPSKWKGTCENETSINGVRCNRKLIGARYFNKGYKAAGGKVKPNWDTPRDPVGHGTHTLSTAGGNFVEDASVFGVANGTAKGGSSSARVAEYKVCWDPISEGDECFNADILQAFDMAIHDGVDVISVSLGGDPSDYLAEAQAIGAFHAVKRGIVTVCSAGNSGPQDATVTNIAPWIITVGASTIDRSFGAFLELRTGLRIKGASLSKELPEDRFYRLIDSANAKAANASTKAASLCEIGSLDREMVKGKIVVCLRGITERMEKGKAAAIAGAAGMILCNDKKDGNEVFADPHILPAIQITYTDALSLYAYLNSTEDPVGFITYPGPQLNIKPAPHMASFSSKGPNKITPQILKPDITAPGVDIIAANSEAKEVADKEYEKRTTPYRLMSGTSMSCPHISGVVGLLKSLHPHWSPAAIRSAIMTTARTRDNTGKPMHEEDSEVKATPFSYGAGHVRPNRAMDPGLVYDLGVNDYVDFLCAIGYNKSAIEKLAEETAYSCPPNDHDHNYSILLNLNYPSITVPKLMSAGSVTVKRRLKNVGAAPVAVYRARVREPLGISVSVEPRKLKFNHIGEEKMFELTLKSKTSSRSPLSVVSQNYTYTFGELLWTDGKHYVRSPITTSRN